MNKQIRVPASEIQAAAGLDNWLRKTKRAIRHQSGDMNGLETRYAGFLDVKKQIGVILSWRFECIKLRLADRTFYTPDFCIISAISPRIELHEVKGFWRDDARVKIKVAASLYPEYDFYAVQWQKKTWFYESFTKPFIGKDIAPVWAA